MRDEDIRLLAKILEERQNDGSDVSKDEIKLAKKLALMVKQMSIAEKAQAELKEITEAIQKLED